MAITWYLDIDWDNDGSYEADEANRMVDFDCQRGRKTYISSDGQRIQPVRIGITRIKLDNYDGRYDAWNASSVLYPDVAPGRLARVRVTDGVDTYTIFSGKIADIVPRGGNNAYVELTIYDGISWLIDRSSSTALYDDIDADAAIGHVLDDVDWPAEWGRALDDAPEDIPYWWTDGDSAFKMITDLTNSGMGTFFAAADGKATYYSRQKVIAASFDCTQSDLLQEIILPQPWDNVRNIITVKANPRVSQSLQVIWTLQDTPSIAPGDSLTVWAEFTYSGNRNPAEDVADPVATTDYTTNTQADGGGIDRTADTTVTITKFADTSKLVIDNDHASDTIFVTLSQVRGKPVAVTSQFGYTAEVQDYATNPRSMTMDLLWLQDTNTARDFAQFLASAIGQPQPFPQIGMIDQFTNQFSVDLFDVIGVELAHFGIDDDFSIAGMSHKWTDSNGQGTVTKFWIEPYSGVLGYWRFTTKIGITSIFGW